MVVLEELRRERPNGSGSCSAFVLRSPTEASARRSTSAPPPLRLLVFLHGFPDCASNMIDFARMVLRQLERMRSDVTSATPGSGLGADVYDDVALIPNLLGYEPLSDAYTKKLVADRGRSELINMPTVAADAVAWVTHFVELYERERSVAASSGARPVEVHLIGHDWGSMVSQTIVPLLQNLLTGKRDAPLRDTTVKILVDAFDLHSGATAPTSSSATTAEELLTSLRGGDTIRRLRVHTTTLIAVAPILQYVPNLWRLLTRQVIRSHYMIYFQFPFGIGERAVTGRNRWWNFPLRHAEAGALVHWFWSRWSPTLPRRLPNILHWGSANAYQQLSTTLADDPEHIMPKDVASVALAAVSYYRSLTGFTTRCFKVLADWMLSVKPVEWPLRRMPCLIVHGDIDGCIDGRFFAEATEIALGIPKGATDPRFVSVREGGHWAHLEAPFRVSYDIATLITKGKSVPPLWA